MVAKFDRHLTTPDQKHLVLMLMKVPWKDTLELHQLDFLAIQLRDHFRSPMLMNHRKLIA